MIDPGRLLLIEWPRGGSMPRWLGRDAREAPGGGEGHRRQPVRGSGGRVAPTSSRGDARDHGGHASGDRNDTCRAEGAKSDSGGRSSGGEHGERCCAHERTLRRG
jgi:hypothetical protein